MKSIQDLMTDWGLNEKRVLQAKTYNTLCLFRFRNTYFFSETESEVLAVCGFSAAAGT